MFYGFQILNSLKSVNAILQELIEFPHVWFKKMSDVGLSAVKYTEILKLKKKLCARRQF